MNKHEKLLIQRI